MVWPAKDLQKSFLSGPCFFTRKSRYLAGEPKHFNLFLLLFSLLKPLWHVHLVEKSHCLVVFRRFWIIFGNLRLKQSGAIDVVKMQSAVIAYSFYLTKNSSTMNISAVMFEKPEKWKKNIRLWSQISRPTEFSQTGKKQKRDWRKNWKYHFWRLWLLFEKFSPNVFTFFERPII